MGLSRRLAVSSYQAASRSSTGANLIGVRRGMIDELPLDGDLLEERLHRCAEGVCPRDCLLNGEKLSEVGTPECGRCEHPLAREVGLILRDERRDVRERQERQENALHRVTAFLSVYLPLSPLNNTMSLLGIT